MLIKVLIGAGIIIVCSLVGIHKSSVLTLRTQLLDQAIVMLKKVEVCLAYERMTTGAVVSVLAQTQLAQQLTFVVQCHEDMEKGMIFPTAWKQSLWAFSRQNVLLDEDVKTLEMIGEILGAADAQSQLREISVVQQLLQQCRDHAQVQAEQKGKLYRSLGVLFGIGLAILMY